MIVPRSRKIKRMINEFKLSDKNTTSFTVPKFPILHGTVCFSSVHFTFRKGTYRSNNIFDDFVHSTNRALKCIEFYRAIKFLVYLSAKNSRRWQYSILLSISARVHLITV